MIGIISRNEERSIVGEFFELFKTPWEFYRHDRSYDVVLSTAESKNIPNARLLLMFGSEKKEVDDEKKIKYYASQESRIVECEERDLPIYGDFLTFHEPEDPLIRTKETHEAVGVEIKKSGKRIIRIGYDLFKEIGFLLNSGQPAAHAAIPTLEIHIDMLRKCILRAGIPLIEIPPVPARYRFIACLTHDVDFFGIRNHRFDHTMYGFIYRALCGSLIGFYRGLISKKILVKNWKAALSLPLVYLGIMKDFMIQFDRYIELEQGLSSTYFFVPWKNTSGQKGSGRAPKKRATKYDITDVVPEIKKLVACGSEVALHGIDAWHDSERGRAELERISQVIGDSRIGVRMHWLYFSENSSKALDQAGFVYDSTIGYNDAVGYRSGTSQVFRLPGTSHIVELPLIVMDTAMFYPQRMNLRAPQAFQLCKRIIDNMRIYGGVFTVNWHERSLAPERNWDDFYINLLEMLRDEKAWFATAKQAVKWFEKRRSILFDEVELSQNKIRVNLKAYKKDDLPNLLIRIHQPRIKSAEDDRGKKDSSICHEEYIDIPWSGEPQFETAY